MSKDSSSPFPSGAADHHIHCACPHCRSTLSIHPEQAGMVIGCPHCGGNFQVPHPFGVGPSPYARTASGNLAYGPSPIGHVDAVREFASKKVAAGVCGILFGGFGVHKFILGLNTAGTVMLVSTLMGWFTGVCLIFPILLPMVMGVIGFVEGILYLTKSDEEFYRTYAIGRKDWF